MGCDVRCWKGKWTYVPTYHQSTVRWIFNVGDWFPYAFFNKRNPPAFCYTLLKFAICYRGLCLKFGNAIRELNTKKIQAIGKLKNLTMVYKWRNITGLVAHHSRGTWGSEGDHGLGATVHLMSKSVYPTMTAVNSVYARHLTETNGLFPSVYRTSGELWQAQTVRGRCPSDGPVYPCKTDTVSSPKRSVKVQVSLWHKGNVTHHKNK